MPVAGWTIPSLPRDCLGRRPVAAGPGSGFNGLRGRSVVAVVVLDVFQKKTRTTPKRVIEEARWRLQAYVRVTREDG